MYGARTMKCCDKASCEESAEDGFCWKCGKKCEGCEERKEARGDG